MTDNNRKASDQGLRYRAPQVKVIEVKAQGVLCGSLYGSPSSNDWNSGSDSNFGFGDEDKLQKNYHDEYEAYITRNCGSLCVARRLCKDHS